MMKATRMTAGLAAMLTTACVGVGGARADVDPAACALPKGPFTVNANQIMGYVGDHQAAAVRLYGITTYGLTLPNWANAAAQQADEAQMDAMRNDWCANTVRIQAAPSNLFTGGGTATQNAYIAAIEGEINHAMTVDHLNVVVTAQTENSTGGTGLPTRTTVNYWRVLGRALIKYPDNLIFDIFNEPRVGPKGSATMWNLWQHGGTFNGVTYLGMQQLVDSIRNADHLKARQLWVEGPEHAGTLSQVAKYPITDPSENLVYDIHHPTGAHTPGQWDTDFGHLAETKPVVIGEWTNYSPSTPSEDPQCWDDAPSTVPEFLDGYVAAKGLSLIGWTLQPGKLISGPALDVPTQIGAGWSCTTHVDQGAGQDLMNFWAANNAKSTYGLG